MKIRRIPETDLARIAVRPVDEQRIHLRQLKGFKPPHTLNPFRSVVPDILNLQHALLGDAGRTTWSRIEEQILKAKESADGIIKNLAVAKALFDFSEQNEIISYAKDVPKWSVGYGNNVAFWGQHYSVWNDEAAFLHFDPRLTNPMTDQARKFAFSLMNQRLRVDDPDFADVRLGVVRFGRGDGNARTLKVHWLNEELYSYDQLNEMIDVTYGLWLEELQSRQVEARRAAGGGNPMGF